MAISAPSGKVRVAVDIGGTFTDLALLDSKGVIHQGKVSSTPDDPSRAVVAGVEALLSELKVNPADVAEVLHGTTVGSNTILQRTGAKTGLITTRGFKDVLEIGRIRMPDMFDLTWDKPKPLVPRRHRLEVTERIAADGSIITPISENDLIAAGTKLQDDGIEAIAICFLNSYRNPVHELEAERLIQQRFPDMLVTTSCSVLPEMKEYERTSTTVVNAYLLVAMRQYLQRLETGLRKIGVSAPILVMTSNGGMLAADVTCEKPVMVVASGPAGGVVGAARLGLAREDKDVIVFDMGGTTAKAVVIEDGRPTMTSEYEFRDGISTSSRFVKAGGYMLKVPAIDIAEVGAGGGSIAGIDKGGLLTVGPHSAGAVPGPACYGLGNEKPTVTDANVVLGYINAQALAGGKLQIDKSLSEKAIKEHVGDRISAEGLDAAHGIRAVANAAMARAVRAVTVERGRDPRDFTLMAFGGNGGVHAPDLARQLGIPRVVIPPMSGIFCAVGMLAADVEHTSLETVAKYLDALTEKDLRQVKNGLENAMNKRLEKDGYSVEKRMFLWEADLRHEGQATELTVAFEGTDIKQIAERFVAEYFKTYGYYDETPIELMKVRLIGRGLRDQRLDFKDMKIAKRDSASHYAKRQVSFGRGEKVIEVDIVGRSDVGQTPRPGPLVIEEFDATIVVPPDAMVSKDSIGCIVVEFSA
jgi:N-methylhydantoinase A